MATNYKIVSAETSSALEAAVSEQIDNGLTPIGGVGVNTRRTNPVLLQALSSGGSGGNIQSDYAENDPSAGSYIQNRPLYSEQVSSTITQDVAENVGNTPDAGYVWYAEKVQDYGLYATLSNFDDGDSVIVTITYSVNGVEKSDSANFVYSIEDGAGSLDSDMPATSRWNGAYASEIDGDTTFRWPVASSDNGQTIYITGVTYERVVQLDSKYLPMDSLYPVGTVYSSISSTPPTFSNGDWQSIGSQTIGSATVYYYKRVS